MRQARRETARHAPTYHDPVTRRRTRSLTLILSALIALTLSGCPRDGVFIIPPDAGRDATVTPDAGPLDAGPPMDAAMIDAGPPMDAGMIDAGRLPDGGRPDAAMRDGGGLPLGSTPAPPATIERMGSGGFLLRGTVLTPTGPLTPGEVLIVGDTITCVAASCAGMPMASTVTVIDTRSTISAGLIDSHNHITYNFLPEWVPDPLRVFGNRYEWADDPMYEAHIRPEAAGGTAGSFICPATKWAELRSIVHGTTTVMGQSPRQRCADRLARNADHYHGLGMAVPNTRLLTNIASVRDVADGPVAGTDRGELVAAFLDGSTTRYVVHMAEGLIGGGMSIDREYESYRGREMRTSTTRTYLIDLLASAGGVPYGTSVFIHSLAMTPAQVDEAAALGAFTVWSPSSNILLYGQTIDIGRLIAAGAVVGLGPDWTVSGSDEVLSEMRYAQAWASAEGVASVTTSRLHDMVTAANARVVGLHDHIGRLVVGARADVAVFGRVGSDPYQAVIDSRAADVRLTFIGGAAYYGDLALELATAVNGDCEMLDACGTPKFLCAANTPGAIEPRSTETVEQIREQLRAHLAAGWDHDRDPMTPNQAYVIGPDEMLGLVDCSL